MEWCGSVFVSACQTQRFSLINSKLDAKMGHLDFYQLLRITHFKEQGVYIKKRMKDAVPIPFYFRFLQNPLIKESLSETHPSESLPLRSNQNSKIKTAKDPYNKEKIIETRVIIQFSNFEFFRKLKGNITFLDLNPIKSFRLRFSIFLTQIDMLEKWASKKKK